MSLACYAMSAILTNQQNIPRIVFMQISAAIIDKSTDHYISATIADN